MVIGRATHQQKVSGMPVRGAPAKYSDTTAKITADISLIIGPIRILMWRAGDGAQPSLARFIQPTGLRALAPHRPSLLHTDASARESEIVNALVTFADPTQVKSISRGSSSCPRILRPHKRSRHRFAASTTQPARIRRRPGGDARRASS